MAQADARQRAAYSGRESTSTRNPHSATVHAAALATKEFSKLSTEERILAQWRAAFGCPISDAAKAQFCINACGKSFALSDVRLWQANHPRCSGKDPNVTERGTIFLEFFFNGSPSELGDQEEVFRKAFEAMIEQQLQERRLTEFRQKLTARRRGKGGTGEAGDVDCDGSVLPAADDEQWRAYLRKPVPSTDLSIRSMREAGCMLRFLVCQTSVSVTASEALGQIAFQEHFPVDGVIQLERSTKPLPKWVHAMMLCTGGMTAVMLVAWWQIVKQVAFSGSSQFEGALP